MSPLPLLASRSSFPSCVSVATRSIKLLAGALDLENGTAGGTVPWASGISRAVRVVGRITHHTNQPDEARNHRNHSESG